MILINFFKDFYTVVVSEVKLSEDLSMNEVKKVDSSLTYKVENSSLPQLTIPTSLENQQFDEECKSPVISLLNKSFKHMNPASNEKQTHKTSTDSKQTFSQINQALLLNKKHDKKFCKNKVKSLPTFEELEKKLEADKKAVDNKSSDAVNGDTKDDQVATDDVIAASRNVETQTEGNTSLKEIYISQSFEKEMTNEPDANQQQGRQQKPTIEHQQKPTVKHQQKPTVKHQQEPTMKYQKKPTIKHQQTQVLDHHKSIYSTAVQVDETSMNKRRNQMCLPASLEEFKSFDTQSQTQIVKALLQLFDDEVTTKANLTSKYPLNASNNSTSVEQDAVQRLLKKIERQKRSMTKKSNYKCVCPNH